MMIAGMITPTRIRDPLTLLVAVVAMVLVLLAPGHATGSAPGPVREAMTNHRHTSGIAAIVTHTNHKGSVHDHAHDTCATRPAMINGLSPSAASWTHLIVSGAPFALSPIPGQPPRP
ncbi:hypothetical protein VW29_09795 [Devosia limi DSM 17137]|uniref:Uncharacterized protein n=1 Tax=Devosia limi DSM 17137 TaxID=1121477 RepID=A0A0F5LSP5_9HYPH|nr:hypothetical protein [Devosia limi]KKB84677.1 hypothetical protein VW29_09795 [Devosia limi DSM 17137]SHF54629.1 hypothetical protein SAMN02745223_02936 [Devosia limi DSM 17137]